ncbi:MAG TPA: glycosyltransferase family 2 protein [Gemmataceae bacterium]|nr:glycosyltransferase family 2 protein [Gemmataceae bacterium]
MSGPTVSVVIPGYRAAAVIGRALDSVLAQTRPADDILVVDDGSPDALHAALAPYGRNIRLLRKTNGGAASARNYGLDHSNGDLVAFLDADDYWEPRKLECQLAVLEANPEVGVLAGRFFIQDPGQPRVVNYAGDSVLYDRVWDRPMGGVAFEIARRMWTSSLLLRRNVLGSLRFDEGLYTAEDVDLWVRLVQAAPVYLDSEPLATAVQEAGSLSRADAGRDTRNMIAVVRRYAALLGTAGVAAWERQLYREWAARELGDGRPSAAVRPACARLWREPWRPQAWWIVCKSVGWATGRRLGALLRPSAARRTNANRREHSCNIPSRKEADYASPM